MMMTSDHARGLLSAYPFAQSVPLHPATLQPVVRAVVAQMTPGVGDVILRPIPVTTDGATEVGDSANKLRLQRVFVAASEVLDKIPLKHKAGLELVVSVSVRRKQVCMMLRIRST